MQFYHPGKKCGNFCLVCKKLRITELFVDKKGKKGFLENILLKGRRKNTQKIEHTHTCKSSRPCSFKEEKRREKERCYFSLIAREKLLLCCVDC